MDTSALIAVLLRETGSDSLIRILLTSGTVIIGAPTLLETYQVAKRKLGPAGRGAVDALIQSVGVTVHAWAADHLPLALSAFDTFGKGSGHTAKLNFGDCMSYAVAKSVDAPLLYKGDDFAQTDIRSAA